jgi:5'-nucleotidase / UDP-sugar diphosphatase
MIAKHSIRLLAAAAVLTLGFSALASAETVKITLLGVGDIYKFDGSKARGGIARLNAVARAERAANPNTLYLFDGDMFSPSLLSGLDKGENMVKLTEIIPFDLAVPGNHEFDFGPELFMERVKGGKYPWAAINLAMQTARQ